MSKNIIGLKNEKETSDVNVNLIRWLMSKCIEKRGMEEKWESVMDHLNSYELVEVGKLFVNTDVMLSDLYDVLILGIGDMSGTIIHGNGVFERKKLLMILK
ncbi:hypothetical protein PV326_012392 [Microctonus aethiopoides]|nr:hypothetical protein PV326_012392 [Microctonus aethiopoides]